MSKVFRDDDLEKDMFEISMNYEYVSAKAVLIEPFRRPCQGGGDKVDHQNCMILAGSMIRHEEVQSCQLKTSDIRRALVLSGALEDKEDYYILTRHTLVPSLSLAEGIVCGNHLNGWITWKRVGTQQTLHDLFNGGEKPTVYAKPEGVYDPGM